MPGGLRAAEYRVQLCDGFGENINLAGGKVFVAQVGTARKQAISNDSGTAVLNPLTPTRGFINFFVPEEIVAVDLYIQFPTGHFLVAKNVSPSGPNEFQQVTADRLQTMVIPFDVRDTGTAEYDTGFVIPSRSVVSTPAFVDVLNTDASGTIAFGSMSTDSGGNATAISGTAKSLAAAGPVLAGNAPANLSGRRLSATVAGTTGAGFMHIPIVLAA